MKHTALLLLSFFMVICIDAQESFDAFFTPGSLRIDFIKAGNATETEVYLTGMKKEPFWGGPVKHLDAPPGYGEYMVVLTDKASSKVIYTIGFSNLFNEWQTTAEAHTTRRAYGQSVVMPFPKAPCTFELLCRNRENRFDTLLSHDIDPSDYFIVQEPPVECKVTRLYYHGDPPVKVDLAILAEGYTPEEMEKFRSDAKRLINKLLSVPPFNQYKDRFNVWLVESPSQQPGTDVPGEGIYVNTALGSSYYTFDLDRYLTTPEFITLRNYAANVPCDHIIVLINSDRYGGGGIYNHYSASTADHFLSPITFIHEFGHGFAGLGDEYYSSEVAYEEFYRKDVEPWEPNLTTLTDFDSKWKDMLAPGTPVPTPADSAYQNIVGVFEGGGYSATGVYRPFIDCVMKSNMSGRFCPVCRRAIVRMIKYFTE